MTYRSSRSRISAALANLFSRLDGTVGLDEAEGSRKPLQSFPAPLSFSRQRLRRVGLGNRCHGQFARGAGSKGLRHDKTRDYSTLDVVIRLGLIGLLVYWSLRVIGPFVTVAH
jgi:hypothetical protein